jgi:hypothetical protein
VKGALVELVSRIGGAVPNVIVFQFNPETMRHTVGQPAPAAAPGKATAAGNALAVAGPPSESFSFSLAMDITDDFADPDPSVRVAARRHGIYARLAALETLLYPIDASGPLTRNNSRGGHKRPTPAAILPTLLFVWGTSRILPVRVTSLTVTEKLYDTDLNPTHAEAQLELQVLTPDELRAVPGKLGQLATAAYAYSQGERIALATANLGNAQRAVIGILGDKHLVP